MVAITYVYIGTVFGFYGYFLFNTHLTLGRPVPALTLYRQTPGRVATGVPIFKLPP